METKNTEYNKIRQVAKDYEKNGYKVIIKPTGPEIPSFIKNYYPDLIAFNDKENVIIEVKTRSDYLTIEELRGVAEEINKQKNWRFELIVIKTNQDVQKESFKLNIDLDFSEITKSLNEVKSILKLKHYSSAFLICWACLESISRKLLLKDNKKLQTLMPLVLIKTIFSFGYISKADYDSLEKFFFLRNQIIHGYKAINLNKKSVERLITITEKLLTENL